MTFPRKRSDEKGSEESMCKYYVSKSHWKKIRFLTTWRLNRLHEYDVARLKRKKLQKNLQI